MKVGSWTVLVIKRIFLSCLGSLPAGNWRSDISARRHLTLNVVIHFLIHFCGFANKSPKICGSVSLNLLAVYVAGCCDGPLMKLPAT